MRVNENPVGAVGTSGNKRLIWDAPIRIVHWSFVILLPALWWSWKSGDMTLHKQLGVVMLGLILFRLGWGIVGSETARFATFVKGPRDILAYLRQSTDAQDAVSVGHNPLGGWSVVAMLGLLGSQVALGLFAQDIDGLESGPLSYLVSYDTADAAREAHEALFNIILALVALHVAAVLFYLLVRCDNLIGPMVNGRRVMRTDAAAPTIVSAWRFLLCATVTGLMAWWIAIGAPLPGAA
jgi:cytochrome b